jgi:hypothetical protein
MPPFRISMLWNNFLGKNLVEKSRVYKFNYSPILGLDALEYFFFAIFLFGKIVKTLSAVRVKTIVMRDTIVVSNSDTAFIDG